MVDLKRTLPFYISVSYTRCAEKVSERDSFRVADLPLRASRGLYQPLFLDVLPLASCAGASAIDAGFSCVELSFSCEQRLCWCG